MIFQPGDICFIKSEHHADKQLVLVLDSVDSDAYQYVSLGNVSNRIHAICIVHTDVTGTLPYDCSPDFRRIGMASKHHSVEKIAQLIPKKLDDIFRAYTKHIACTSHRITQQTNRTYIPVSGKVLDEHELCGMIDASLDMWLTTGRWNDRFEENLGKFLGARYVASTNSGSSANLLAVATLTSHKLGERRLKRGDEVITIGAGFPTTISPIVQYGLIPVFVDVKLGTYNIDVHQLDEALSPKTRALFVAHTLGNPFDIDAVMAFAKKHNLWVIEDNCDALGSVYRGKRTGTFGHLSTCSFYPAHHITMGEGGAVVTNDGELYRILISLRDWGRDCWCPPGKDNTCGKRFHQQFGNLPLGYDHKYVYSHCGYNLKITDWQAAIGCAQLEKLPTFIQKRRENFERLYAGLQHLEHYFILPQWDTHSEPSWFGFLITIKDTAHFTRVELVRYLEEHGIGTRQLFAGNMLRQPAFVDNDIQMRIRDSKLFSSAQLTECEYTLLPNTDAVMNATFWVGVWPGITPEHTTTIVQAIENFTKK